MQLAFELPNSKLQELGKYDDNHFCLAHLALSNPQYLSYYRAETKYKICDNSAFELETPLSHAEIIKAAVLLNAQEVVAPDHFRDYAQTIQATQEFIDFMKNSGDIGKFKIMGVVQGENVPRWIESLDYLLRTPEIDVVGISYIGCEVFNKDLTQGRLDAVRTYRQLLKGKKPIHLLGIGGNPIEIKLHGDNPLIRSCDTSFPIVYGYARKTFDFDNGATKLPRQPDFFDGSVDNEQLAIMAKNIEIMKSWAAIGQTMATAA